MIKVYVMHTCPDCEIVERQVQGDSRFELIDLGTHVRHLKEFLRLRDTHPAFEDVKSNGYIGIPCFLLEDGTVTFDLADAGLSPQPSPASCRLDGTGC